jgi:hypothetical protein
VSGTGDGRGLGPPVQRIPVEGAMTVARLRAALEAFEGDAPVSVVVRCDGSFVVLPLASAHPTGRPGEPGTSCSLVAASEAALVFGDDLAPLPAAVIVTSGPTG